SCSSMDRWPGGSTPGSGPRCRCRATVGRCASIRLATGSPSSGSTSCRSPRSRPTSASCRSAASSAPGSSCPVAWPIRASICARADELAAPARSAVGQLLVRAGLEAGRVRLDADVLRVGRPILATAVELPLIVELTPELGGSIVRWDQAGRHRVFAIGRGLDDELLAALTGIELDSSSAAVAIDGGREAELTFDIFGAGTLDGFRVDGTIAGRLVSGDRALQLAATLELDEARQRVDLAIEPERGRGLVGTVELAAAVPALVAGEQQLAAIPLLANIAAPHFDLRELTSLLPSSVVNPGGYLHADLRGRGTVGAPR